MVNKKQKPIPKVLETQEINQIDDLINHMPPEFINMLVNELRNNPDIEFEPEDDQNVEIDLSYYEDREQGYFMHEEDDEFEPGTDEDPFTVIIEEDEAEYLTDTQESVGYSFNHAETNPELKELHQEIMQLASYTVNGKTQLINIADIENYTYTHDYANCYLLNFVEYLVINDKGLPILPLSQQTPEFAAQYRNQQGFHLLNVRKIRELLFQINNLQHRERCLQLNEEYEPLTAQDLAVYLFRRRFEIQLEHQVRAYELKKYGTNDSEEIYHLRLQRREARLATQAQ